MMSKLSLRTLEEAEIRNDLIELIELRKYKAAIEAQEPVGWMNISNGAVINNHKKCMESDGLCYPLFNTPLFTNKVKELE